MPLPSPPPYLLSLISSQTLNSVVMAKAGLRAELAASSDDRQLYTYCQDYHSMTFEPIDTDSEKKAQRYTWSRVRKMNG